MDTTLAFISLVLVLALHRAQGNNCPNHHPHTTAVYRRDNYCYQFVKKELYWTGARDYCRSRGGHLVHVDSEELNAWLIRKLDELSVWHNNGVWIGLHDVTEELTFMWVTNDKYLHNTLGSFTYWGSGHPEGFWHTSRDCVRMVRDDNWRWHETFCTALNWKYRFICQYDVPEPSESAEAGGFDSQFDDTTTPPPTPTMTPTLTARTTQTARLTEGEVFRTTGEQQSSSHKKTDGDHQTTNEDEYDEDYYTEFKNRELPIPLAQLGNREEVKKDAGIVGGVMAGLVGIIIILIILLFAMRRRRQKQMAEDAECYPQTTPETTRITSPSKDQACCAPTPDVLEHRLSNVYVAPPGPEVQSNPLPPPPPTAFVPDAVDHTYADVDEVRGKVKVVERNDLEAGGSQVKVMISRGKGSCASYVMPDKVTAAPRLKKKKEEEEEMRREEGGDINRYMSMDGSPRNSKDDVANQNTSPENSCDADIDAYDRPNSPLKSRPIRALEYDTPSSVTDNGPIKAMNYDTPPSVAAKGPITTVENMSYGDEVRGQSVAYDVPRPEHMYSEISENIYEDLDEYQARRKDTEA